MCVYPTVPLNERALDNSRAVLDPALNPRHFGWIMCVYEYVYIHVCVCVCVCVYMNTMCIAH